MSQAKPPKPAFTVALIVGGCEWERVAERLEAQARHIREHGPGCSAVWGGAGTHGHVQIERRDVTEEQYKQELNEWWVNDRASKVTP